MSQHSDENRRGRHTPVAAASTTQLLCAMRVRVPGLQVSDSIKRRRAITVPSLGHRDCGVHHNGHARTFLVLSQKFSQNLILFYNFLLLLNSEQNEEAVGFSLAHFIYKSFESNNHHLLALNYLVTVKITRKSDPNNKTRRSAEQS